jgi:AbiV family abortive infection protein
VIEMPVTPEYLIRGAALALEQCGLLLRDANCLFKNRSYASAVVMAAFAREELGRAKTLLDFRSDLLGGATVTDEQITETCEDHVRKQRASMASSTLAAETGSVRKLLDERTSGAAIGGLGNSAHCVFRTASASMA